MRLALSKLIPNAFPNVDVGDGPKRPDQLSIVKAQAIYPSSTTREQRPGPAQQDGVQRRAVQGPQGYSPVDVRLNRVPDGPHGHHGGKKRAGACGRGTS